VLGAALLLVSLAAGGCSRPVSTAQPPPGPISVTLPPGQSLPSDAECAAQVVPSGEETRTANARYNQSRGWNKTFPGRFLSRVSGDFTGTTDEIIQWASCKWGIDTDVVRAQAAQESSWFMSSIGDFTDQTSWCAPGHVPGADGRPGCPESVGMMGVKYRYHSEAFPEAQQSTAYNVDYTLAVWRSCFEGEEAWLSNQPPRSGYRAGDLWGCVGRWYAGDWRSANANGYISRVQTAMTSQVWTTEWFAALRSPASSG
jgi:autotransporter family porin